MKLEIEIKNTENITDLSQMDVMQIKHIVEALVSSGGLTGVKGGQTIIHFDQYGKFKHVQLSYIPFVNRS